MTPTAMTTHGQLAISVKRASRWHNLNAPISNYTRRTVLLAGPAPSLQPVMAETEWPLGVLAIFIPRISVRPSLFRHRTEFRVGGTYNSPWSVEGGASRSGFCRSMGMFSLVIVGAPSCPRTGSGLTPGAFGWKITLLGSSLARGAVASGGAIEVPEGRGRASADADSPASGAAPTAGAALDAGLSLTAGVPLAAGVPLTAGTPLLAAGDPLVASTDALTAGDALVARETLATEDAADAAVAMDALAAADALATGDTLAAGAARADPSCSDRATRGRIVRTIAETIGEPWR